MAVIIPIVADIKGLARGVDDTEKTLGRLGKNVGKLGANLTKSVTLPIVGLGVASLAAFNEVDKGLDAVAAGTGATGDALKNLQASFKNVAANATQGMEEVGNVVAEVNTRLGLTGKPLEDFSERVLKMSRVMGVDAVAASKSITRAMNDAGVAVEDSAAFMDMLVVASQQTGIGVDVLSDKLVKFGSPMRQLGFSVEETAALLGEFEKAGVNTDLVMGSLRIGLGKLAKAGEKDLPKALRQSIAAIKNAETGGEAAAMAMELFGTRAGADMAAAIREGRLDVDSLVATLMDAEGALDATAAATEGPQEQLAKMKNQLTLVGASFAEVFIPVLEKALGPIQRLLTAFRNLSPAQKNFIVSTLAVAAAVGPILIIVGKAITLFVALKSIIIAVRTAMLALNLALIANPIGLIVIAVAALVAGLVLAYKRSETFRNIVDKLAATVKDALMVAFEELKKAIDVIWPALKSAFDQARPVLELLGKAVELYVSTYIKLVSTYVKAWITIFKEAYELLKPVVLLIGNLVKDYIVANVKAIKTAVDAGVTAFNAIKGAVTSVRDAIDKPLDRIESMIRSAIGGAADYAKGAIRGITGVFETVVTGIRNFWNKNVGGKGFTVPGWVPGFGGNSFKIPMLAEGGIVRSPTLAMVGEAGPEAVIPLNKLNSGGSTYNIVVNAGLGTNPDELSRVIVDSIKYYERRNGQVFTGPLVPTVRTASGSLAQAASSGPTDFNRISQRRRG